jgi:hypothetical protein
MTLPKEKKSENLIKTLMKTWKKVTERTSQLAEVLETLKTSEEKYRNSRKYQWCCSHYW